MHVSITNNDKLVKFSHESGNKYEEWILDFIGSKAITGSPLHYCGVVDTGNDFPGSKYTLKFNFNGKRIHSPNDACVFAGGIDILLQAVSLPAIEKLKLLETLGETSNSCLQFVKYYEGGVKYLVFEIRC